MLTIFRASRRQFLCGIGASPAAVAVDGHPAALALGALSQPRDVTACQLSKIYVTCGLGEVDRLALLSAACLFPWAFENIDLRRRNSAEAACWALRDFSDGVALVDCRTFADVVDAGLPLVSVAQLSCGWPFLVACRQDDRIRAVEELSGATVLVNGQREARAFVELTKRLALTGVTFVGVAQSAEHDLAAKRNDAILVSRLQKADFADKGHAFRYLEVPALDAYPRNCMIVNKRSLRNSDFVVALKKLLLALEAGTAFLEEHTAMAVKAVAVRFPHEVPARREMLQRALTDAFGRESHNMRKRRGFGIHLAEEWSRLRMSGNKAPLDEIATELYFPRLVSGEDA